MIDFHLHLLPGIDDGADTPETSRAMLRRLAAMGATRIVTTPHLMEPLRAPYQLLIETSLDEYRPIAAAVGIELQLGYEHMLDPGLTKRLELGEPTTLAGSRAVLVELPFIGWPQHVESSLFALRIAGYIPVLAHPERYVEVQKDPDLAITAGERGAVLQLTSGSFAGVYGKTVERSARRLLDHAIERDVRVVLASDAHSDGQRLDRVPAGWKWIGSNLDHGRAVVEWSTCVVPQLLLDDMPAPAFREWFASRSPSPTSSVALPGKRWRWLPGNARRS